MKNLSFRRYKLGDIANIDISNVDKKSVEGEPQVRLCNFVDVYHNWAITKKMYSNLMVATAKDKQIDKFQLKKGQVAITKDSETRDDIGIAAYIADDFDDVVLGYHCALITPNEEIIDGSYLNAFMHSRYIQKYFENNATGSGMRYTLSTDSLNNIPILIPSLKEQKEIGKLFSNIDKKIALTRSINQNLESLTKQLYDYWFVQFDFPDAEGKPYKSSGGKMEWNEKLKRNVPEGWTDTILGNICKMYQPKTLSTSELDSNAEYKVYGANGIIGRYSQFNHSDSEIAMACRGNSCGVLNRTAPFSWITGNAMVIKLIDHEIHNEYIKQALRYANVKGVITGSGQPQITRENLSRLKMMLPEKDILLLFSRKIASVIEIIQQNNKQIESLTRQRDELLPLLMNGQVSINTD